jgi:hypothetical protein
MKWASQQPTNPMLTLRARLSVFLSYEVGFFLRERRFCRSFGKNFGGARDLFLRIALKGKISQGEAASRNNLPSPDTSP